MPKTGYSRLQIALHWLVAILIPAAWITHDGAEAAMRTLEDGGTVGFLPHAALGLAVLALVVVRILVRMSQGAPTAPGEPGSLMVKAADWGHRVIYLLMLAVPLGGIGTWFLGLDSGEIHGLAGNALMLVVLGHVLMALYHQFVVKDGLMNRMMRPQ